jgi:hypothetical protein
MMHGQQNIKFTIDHCCVENLRGMNFLLQICQYCTHNETNTDQSIDHTSRATFFKILPHMTAFPVQSLQRKVSRKTIYIAHTDTRRLTTGVRSEKCVVRRSDCCANVIENAYINLDSTCIAYYTPKLYGIAYCS